MPPTAFTGLETAATALFTSRTNPVSSSCRNIQVSKRRLTSVKTTWSPQHIFNVVILNLNAINHREQETWNQMLRSLSVLHWQLKLPHYILWVASAVLCIKVNSGKPPLNTNKQENNSWSQFSRSNRQRHEAEWCKLCAALRWYWLWQG